MCRLAGIWRAGRARASAPNWRRQGARTSAGRWATGTPHGAPEQLAVGPLPRGDAADIGPQRQDALKGAVAALALDAEEARVGDGLDDSFHLSPSCLARISRSNELSLRLAPSMNVPRALAKGSSAVRS